MLIAAVWTVAFSLALVLSAYLLYQSRQDEKYSSDYTRKTLATWTFRSELVRFFSLAVFTLIGVLALINKLSDVFVITMVVAGSGLILNTAFTFIYRRKIYENSSTQ